jgi:hypothetical protein
LKEEIEHRLGDLVGLPLIYSRRAVDMEMFGFGHFVERETRRSVRIRVAENRLHVQCQWRIVRDRQVLVGYGDWRWPPSGSDVDLFDFDAADAPLNRRDELVDGFLQHGATAHQVQGLSSAPTGDLAIDFADGCRLEVFANYATQDPGSDEYWRFLPPGEGEDHFVVTSRGITT